MAANECDPFPLKRKVIKSSPALPLQLCAKGYLAQSNTEQSNSVSCKGPPLDATFYTSSHDVGQQAPPSLSIKEFIPFVYLPPASQDFHTGDKVSTKF